MHWFAAAATAYFLGALTSVFDKFLLGSKRISDPVVYAFYMAVFGLFVIFFMPFGFSVPHWNAIGISLGGGVIYIYSLFAIYLAIQEARASQVLPLIGAVTPIAAYFFSFLFFGEVLGPMQVFGILLLIAGGLLISFDLPLSARSVRIFQGSRYAVLAGILTAAAFSILKLAYRDEAFLNGFIWTRFGALLGALGFFLHPRWRRKILDSFRGVRHPQQENLKTGAMFVVNKSLGGSASILLNYAVVGGSVTLVESLISLQYVFVLVLAFIFQKVFPEIFREKFSFWDWFQKIAAVILIVAGTYIVFIK